jgi:extracellular matrix regulatory protein A
MLNMSEIITMLDVGFKNYIRHDYITEIIKPSTSSAKMLSNEAIINKRVIDCTHGKKTKTLLLLKTRHLVLSAVKYSYFEKKVKTPHDDAAIDEKIF